MFDRFTDRARKVMGPSREAAQRWQHDYFGTEHPHIVLQEIEEEDWGFAGLLTDDWKKQQPRSKPGAGHPE